MTHNPQDQASELKALFPPRTVLLGILDQLDSDAERIAAVAVSRRLSKFSHDVVLEESVRSGVSMQMERIEAVWFAAVELLVQAAKETRNDSPSLKDSEGLLTHGPSESIGEDDNWNLELGESAGG